LQIVLRNYCDFSSIIKTVLRYPSKPIEGMKKSILFLILFGLAAVHSYACLNTFHALDKEGHFHELGYDKFVGFNTNFNPRLMNRKFPKIEKEIRETKSPYRLSDYAVLLLKAGKTQESLDILIALNHNLPNEYKIAANLGTAYEIAGNLDSALHYIKRGVELNPNAHDGSEWIHIAILETKIGLLSNPQFLADRTVLQLTESQEKDSAVRTQLEIQIRERFPFSPEGNDPLMASLLIDLGDCYMESGTYEHAKAFFTIAREYYGASEDEVAERIETALVFREKYKGVQVPDYSMEGVENKVQSVRYNSILDDNNSPPFKIDWTKINHDATALLSLADMKMSKEEAPSLQMEEDQIIEENDNTTNKERQADKNSIESIGMLFGSGFAAIGLGIYFWSVRKRRRAQA
jgi:tetratricopeptide (TPR) repeat protein